MVGTITQRVGWLGGFDRGLVWTGIRWCLRGHLRWRPVLTGLDYD